MQPPVFVLGVPRSGTTYLTEVLNSHEEVLITNEFRIMAFINHCLNKTARQHWLLRHYNDEFIDFCYKEIGPLIERFYATTISGGKTIWGDKNPHYADPRTDPGCLTLIDRVYPQCSFVHIHRDPRNVIASIMKKGWCASLEEAIDAWCRQIATVEAFFGSISPDRHFTIRYESLLERPAPILDELFRRMGLAPSEQVTRFLAQQKAEPTPFSDPTTNLAETSDGTSLNPDDLAKVEEDTAHFLKRLGYRRSVTDDRHGRIGGAGIGEASGPGS